MVTSIVSLPWIAPCPMQAWSALCKSTQGENDGNCEEPRCEQGSPREEGRSCQEGSSAGKEGRSGQEGGTRQEGCRSGQEGGSAGKEGRSGQEGGTRQEGCRSGQEGRSAGKEGRSGQEDGTRQEGCRSGQEGRSARQEGRHQGSRRSACPRRANHAEPPGRMALPYGWQAVRSRRPLPRPGACTGFFLYDMRPRRSVRHEIQRVVLR